MSDVCASRHRGNPESVEANDRIESSKAALRWRIMSWFFEHGPATCEEASRGTRIQYQTMSARISELKRDGLLAPTGQRRKTSGGSWAGVLKVVLGGAPTWTQPSLWTPPTDLDRGRTE